MLTHNELYRTAKPSSFAVRYNSSSTSSLAVTSNEQDLTISSVRKFGVKNFSSVDRLLLSQMESSGELTLVHVFKDYFPTNL